MNLVFMILFISSLSIVSVMLFCLFIYFMVKMIIAIIDDGLKIKYIRFITSLLVALLITILSYIMMISC